MHKVIERHRVALVELCRRHHVRRLDLFGSGARGVDFDPEGSDADFVVDFEATQGGPTLTTFFSLRSELSALLGRPVDLVMLGGLTNPYVKAEIEQTREQVYAA